MELSVISVDEWATERQADDVGVFHSPASLRVLDAHTDGELRLFVAHNGDRLVGLLPVFSRETPLGSAFTSPPPGFNLPYLGPVLLPASPKQRKREQLNREFTDAVVDRLLDETPRSVLRVVCPPEYDDPRPFQWAGFDVETRFTYRLGLDGQSADDVQAGFSRSLRREIQAAEESPITVSQEGLTGARLVFDDCAERYAEQDRPYPLTWPFVRDLVDALGDDARVFVTRGPDEEYLGGIVVLHGGSTAYFWQGGVRHAYDNLTTNSLLHWEIVRSILDDEAFAGVTEYDLFGANTARLCEYKAKFGGRLVPYYSVESSGPGMTMAKSAYSLAGRLGTAAQSLRSEVPTVLSRR